MRFQAFRVIAPIRVIAPNSLARTAEILDTFSFYHQIWQIMTLSLLPSVILLVSPVLGMVPLTAFVAALALGLTNAAIRDLRLRGARSNN